MIITPSPLKHYKTLQEYYDFAERLTNFEDLQEKIKLNRLLCRTDLFWLIWMGCKRSDIANQWLLDRCKEVEAKPNDHLDLWSRNHYKAVDLNELVPTPAGMVKHGDLAIGDYVYSPNGKKIKVLAKTKVFTDAECFKVHFDCGYSVIVSGDHLWTIQQSSKKRINGSNLREGFKSLTLNTFELLEEVDKSKNYKSKIYPRIEISKPLVNCEQDLPIDPYVLGAWLGDGSKGTNQITSGYEDWEEMATNLRQSKHNISFRKMESYVRIIVDAGEKNRKGTCSFKNSLRELGIFTDKRIPEIYFNSSELQRLALLQGLMDTDGNCHKKHSQAIFCNSNEHLAKDVLRLASSLGLKTSIKKRSGKYKGGINTLYQVQFKACKDYPCFRLSRKQLYASSSSKTQTRYYKIINVEKVESIPVSCIQVDSNDGLYLIGEQHIATHNSTIITFGKSLQDILASHGDNPLSEWNREVTIGIFSATRPLAKGFLRQIKQELESNQLLKSLFPDILYDKPQSQATKWALDINTPVLTSIGWKKHGDLQVGDSIYGSSGQPIKVIGTSGEMFSRECYKIVFDDCEIIADAEHLWSVECKKGTGDSWKNSEIKILKTTELKAKSKQMRLLLTPIVDIKQPSQLLIDPYILGLWLGDGTAGTNIISMHKDDEKECLEQFAKAGYEFYIHRKKDQDNFAMYALRGLREQLEKLGCLREKTIPNDYLFGTIEQRRALLQGLMDSDGTCKKISKAKSHGMCTFSNTNPNLADGVFFLTTSLGMRPSRIKFIPKTRGKKEAHHIYFVGTKINAPFRSARKLQNCKESRTLKHRYIQAIEQVESRPVNCIKVDAPNSLYLAGRQMVVTHNSEDEGIIVKRKGNPKEATVEAWGLIDGMPVGKHFFLMVYDDVVTDTNVTTPEMIFKTTEKWELSSNLGTAGGLIRYIGTRYHFNDTYQTMLNKNIATPRIYPCTDDGTVEGKPVLMSAEELEKKRKLMGEYIFSCFVAGTKILMSDFSERNLEELNVGDEIIGYELNGGGGRNGRRRRVIPTKIIATNQRDVEVVKFTFESGKTITGTRDHKFYTGRYEADHHNVYAELGFKYHQLKGAISFYNSFKPIDPILNKDAGWLAGIFDGEGSATSTGISICQSFTHNPQVCAEIERVLNLFNFKFTIHERQDKGKEGARLYVLKGGRQEHLRFLTIINPVRKYKIINVLLKRANKFFGYKNRDNLVSIEPQGIQRVYTIQTESGNYIANTFAVKNCQLLLNPTASSLQNFKESWLKYYGGWAKHYTGNIYIIVDPANSKKKSSDYTVMFVVAACDDQNYYIVDIIRDRLNLKERTENLFALVKQYQNKGLIRVGYEQYGMQADIEHIREKQDELNYHFTIKELGGRMAKTDRIGKLVPDFEAGKIYIPRQIMKKNYEGRMQNLVDIFIKEEYLTFPTPQHDDMLDALARIKDDELNVSFPLPIIDDYEEFNALDNQTRNTITGY